MGQFERHVFVCTSGSWCPRIDGDGLGVHARLKQAVAAAGLKGRVRVNHAGCMDQCGHGPMVVVYPEGVWYGGVTVDDGRNAPMLRRVKVSNQVWSPVAGPHDGGYELLRHG